MLNYIASKWDALKTRVWAIGVVLNIQPVWQVAFWVNRAAWNRLQPIIDSVLVKHPDIEEVRFRGHNPWANEVPADSPLIWINGPSGNGIDVRAELSTEHTATVATVWNKLLKHHGKEHIDNCRLFPFKGKKYRPGLYIEGFGGKKYKFYFPQR